jgi:sulfur-oxidizing protein SoxX
MTRQTGTLHFAISAGATAAGAALAASLLIVPALAQDSQKDTDALRPYAVVGKAIPQSLTGVPGDAANGRRVAMNRESGDCVLCHALPDMPPDSVHGNVGPPLAGVGARLNAAEFRMRIVDPTRLNPDSVMPAYYRVRNLTQVASAYRGKPVLTAQEVEDVIAYLQGLR